MTRPPYDPLEILAALERNRVAFVLIGRLAAVIHGAGGIADDVEICVQVKEANLDRLRRALQQIDVTDGLDSISAIAEQADAATNVELHSPVGSIVLQARPAGTRGWDDLRRRANREPIGNGVRTPTAAAEDLVRIAAARDEPSERDELVTLRRVAELEKARSRGL